MGLFEILGTDDPGVVSSFLKEHYIENSDEMKRQAHAKLLDDFYANKGDQEMERVIDLLWEDPKNNKRRKAVLKAGIDKYDNIVARIAEEKATVYNEPAKRKVANDTDETYQKFLGLLPMDVIMRELDIKLAIHEDALLWYRVRVKPTGEREPVLEVVSPAAFWAVCHPRDRTLLVAIIFDQRMPLSKPEDPTYRVWTDDQTFVMNANCDIFPESIESWPIGAMPGVLCSTRPPGAKSSLLAECPSSDLLSAQRAVRLQDLNLAKESISANKQAYVSGDTSSTAMGQSADTDGEIILGEGVSVQTVDRGVDTEQFRDNASHAADAAGANHGVPPTVRSQKDASSGAEIELRMLPIRKLREKRIPVFRGIETSIALVMSRVNGQRVQVDEAGEPVGLVPGDLQDFSFSVEGFSIDFGEVQQVQTEAEKDATYDTRKGLQLTDPIEEEMRRNPDLKTDKEAQAVIKKRIERNTWFVTEQKDLMAASGSLGAASPKSKFEANRGERKDDADLRSVAKEILDGVN
jgi:hypothetical protein